MSGTRTAKDASKLRQERWASSPALSRGLKANLVALRCSVLESAEKRNIIWALQYFSQQPGALGRVANAVRITEPKLVELCLNPESDIQPYALDLWIYLDAFAKSQVSPAITGIGAEIHQGLEYCCSSRGLVLISGRARLGKTFAAQAFCKIHPGRARYLEVPSGGDDLSFFCAIGRSLGITIESDAKTKYLRPRIEAVLRSGDLALVLDAAEHCWPGHSYRLARPSRICWLMQLINQRVPICLISTEDFFRAQSDYERKSGWQSAQWTGRIGKFIQLPEKLGISDLEKVARAWLPHGDKKSIESLADLANLSTKHLAAIEHTVNQARFYAQQRGKDSPSWEDVQRAIRESAIPSDLGLATAMNKAGKGKLSSPVCELFETLSRDSGGDRAAKN